ncbi:MAG: flagellar export chaperone FliS [Myxococcota bacterium]
MSNPYREMEIRTATPLRLIVRLYERALRHLREAGEHHAAARVKPRGEALARALAIISELRNALDFEQGGEVARNLDALYAYSIDRLIDTNLEADGKGIGEVIAILEPLHESWAEIERRPPEGVGETSP